MTSRDFCFFLQGLFEVGDVKYLTEKQVTLIRNHLNLVFKCEIDPSAPGNQEELNDIHDGTPVAELTEEKKKEIIERASRDNERLLNSMGRDPRDKRIRC
jgi:hypothetical protein